MAAVSGSGFRAGSPAVAAESTDCKLNNRARNAFSDSEDSVSVSPSVTGALGDLVGSSCAGSKGDASRARVLRIFKGSGCVNWSCSDEDYHQKARNVGSTRWSVPGEVEVARSLGTAVASAVDVSTVRKSRTAGNLP